MAKNYLITGTSGVGKSFLVNKLVDKLDLDITGFKTLPYFIENNKKGYYFHSIEYINEFYNDFPISIITGDRTCIPVAETFATLGVKCLNVVKKSGKKYVVLDEIGKFERNSQAYIDLLNQVLDSEKTVFGVIKKDDVAFINDLKARQDCTTIDLDHISVEDAFSFIYNNIRNTLKGENNNEL